MTNERDPALDQAWRAHSRETPPPALDAAILAAAHRAVDSKPRAATGAPRWWMPLLAVATIGAVAIGVVQLAPPEQPGLDTGSSSVVASIAQKPAQLAVEAPAADAPKAVAEPEARAKKQKETAADKDVAASAPASKARAASKAEAPAAAPVVASTPAPPPPPAAQEALARENKIAAERRPEPFPAAPPQQKTEATDDKRAGALGGRDAQGFATDAVTPGAKRDEAEQARKDSMNERQLAAAAPARAATAAAPAAAPPPAAAPVPAQPLRSMEADRGRAQVAGMLQKNAAAPAESVADKARDPDAWIARIRKLRDEGQTAEALRELREFRANVPDAEKRLPADLRDWKP